MTRPGGGPGDPDDRDDGDPGDGRDGPEGRDDARDAGEPRGLIRSLLALLQEMEERGEQHRTGHSRPNPHTSVDFSVSVGGLGDLGGPGQGDPFGTEDERAGGGNAPSEAAESDPHVTTRETDEGIVVAVDLPGVHEADVETRLEPDADALVVEVDGRDAARLPLQSDGWTVVDSRFTNGVLEVELRRD